MKKLSKEVSREELYDNNEDCMPTVECWRYVLTKWMEEQQNE